MSKNKDKIEKIDTEGKKSKKKKMSKYKRHQMIMKIAAWVMATIMIVGVIMSFLVYFIYI